MLFLGSITAVMGILYAMMEKDLKRLLAYSTIENIGIVFVSLGLALAFQANGLKAAAALAFTAALFHALNHSFFKSLLFFGAGAVLTATGERDMDKLGGLIHRMPYTSFVVLVGCVAISALPPFNGFVSEWLIFQAVLQSPELPQWALKIMVPAVGAMLALAAALAAACFVKAYGVTFLGRPRSAAAEAAHEVDRFSLAAMSVLAALCLLAGILPGLVIDAIAPVATANSRQPHARPGRPSLAFDRADRGEPQLLQRIAGDDVRHDNRVTCRVCHSPLRLTRVAAGAGLGMRFLRRHTRRAIFGRQLRPADPPRVRHAAVPCPRSCRHAAAGRHSGRRGCGSKCTIWSGAEYMRRSRPPSASCRRGSIACSS